MCIITVARPLSSLGALSLAQNPQIRTSSPGTLSQTEPRATTVFCPAALSARSKNRNSPSHGRAPLAVQTLPPRENLQSSETHFDAAQFRQNANPVAEQYLADAIASWFLVSEGGVAQDLGFESDPTALSPVLPASRQSTGPSSTPADPADRGKALGQARNGSRPLATPRRQPTPANANLNHASNTLTTHHARARPPSQRPLLLASLRLSLSSGKSLCSNSAPPAASHHAHARLTTRRPNFPHQLPTAHPVPPQRPPSPIPSSGPDKRWPGPPALAQASGPSGPSEPFTSMMITIRLHLPLVALSSNQHQPSQVCAARHLRRELRNSCSERLSLP